MLSELRSSRHFFRLDISSAVLPEPVVDHGSRNAAIVSRLDKILKQALGSRAKIVALVQTPSKPFLSTESQPPEPTVIEVGIILDPDNAPRLVDHGPPAEDPEACERFRDFWGEKSELRRFNDGRIVESVVWELVGKSTGERLQIPGRIVRYIVGRHLQIPSEDVTVFNTQYDGVLSIPPDIASRYSTVAPATAPEAVQRLVVSAYDELVKDIKAMENIPLGLVTSSPVSDVLRYTAVFPTLPLDMDAYPLLPDHAKYLPATEIVLQFERSSQWPDDLAAIQKVKMALLEAIAQLLNTGGSKASVALDRNSDPIEDHVSLEIILPSGFAFRARIYHDREQTLLERLIADRNTPEYKRKHFQTALHHHLKRFVHAPRHHAALHALHHRYPSYSHTTRLVKRWLNAHWLAPHISPEAIELLCAHVYLDAGVREPPTTGVSGFSRVVTLLAEWNWRESPLVVPVYTSASVVDRTHGVVFPPDILNQAQERFTKHRAVDPGFSRGAWTIVTEEDLSGHIWSDSVDSIIAGRAKDLAKATSDYLRKSMDDGELNIKASLL
jgi:U3 small nucleolar RNA-associated protein 22